MAGKKRRPLQLGSVRFKPLGGKSGTVVLKLSAKAKRALVSRHALKVRITVKLSANGGSWVTHRTVTLKLPAKHTKKG